VQLLSICCSYCRRFATFIDEAWKAYLQQCWVVLSLARERGHGPAGAEVSFHNSIIDKFHGLSRTMWNKFIAANREARKYWVVFYTFCFYFWGQHWCWTETSITRNDLFCFSLRYHCHQHSPSLPLSYRCSGIPVANVFMGPEKNSWLMNLWFLLFMR